MQPTQAGEAQLLGDSCNANRAGGMHPGVGQMLVWCSTTGQATSHSLPAASAGLSHPMSGRPSVGEDKRLVVSRYLWSLLC